MHSLCQERGINMIDRDFFFFQQARQNFHSHTCIPNKAEDEHRWSVLNEAPLPHGKHTEVKGLII